MKNWLNRLVIQTLIPKNVASAEPCSSDLPLVAEWSEHAAVPNQQLVIEQLHRDCQRQLELLQLSLDLTTAALLWTGPETDQLSLYACSSQINLLEQGPWPLGEGVTGGLKEHGVMLLAPVREHSPAIPYYRNNSGVGSFMATRLFISDDADYRLNSLGILCVDRSQSLAWSESEQDLVTRFADQLLSFIRNARKLLDSDRHRHAYQRAFDGVRLLNAALGLQSAFAATAEAIRSIVPADFLAISLAEEELHRIAYAEGEQAELLAEKYFPLDQGVVGQVLKYARTLPEDADYRGNLPVFSDAHLFANYRSLMIVPICREKGDAIGALIVATRKKDAFSRTCREMLELLAEQVAIKINLANTHEKINRMATVDTLTGIANRRAYQRGFEAMLDRAKRRSGSLYLILCDIDHFKRINDGFGHPAGDEVLRQVAKLFERVVRTGDLAARTGGEEFAILLEDSDGDGAWKVAERLRNLVEELEVIFSGQRSKVTISLGIAAYPRDANSLEQLVSCADRALYQAKESGRNRSVLWGGIP